MWGYNVKTFDTDTKCGSVREGFVGEIEYYPVGCNTPHRTFLCEAGSEPLHNAGCFDTNRTASSLATRGSFNFFDSPSAVKAAFSVIKAKWDKDKVTGHETKLISIVKVQHTNCIDICKYERP